MRSREIALICDGGGLSVYMSAGDLPQRGDLPPCSVSSPAGFVDVNDVKHDSGTLLTLTHVLQFPTKGNWVWFHASSNFPFPCRSLLLVFQQYRCSMRSLTCPLDNRGARRRSVLQHRAAFTPGRHVARKHVSRTSNLYPDTSRYIKWIQLVFGLHVSGVNAA